MGDEPRTWNNAAETHHRGLLMEIARLALQELTDLERAELFGEWCRWCGGDDLPCYCMCDD